MELKGTGRGEVAEVAEGKAKGDSGGRGCRGSWWWWGTFFGGGDWEWGISSCDRVTFWGVGLATVQSSRASPLGVVALQHMAES